MTTPMNLTGTKNSEIYNLQGRCIVANAKVKKINKSELLAKNSENLNEAMKIAVLLAMPKPMYGVPTMPEPISAGVSKPDTVNIMLKIVKY